MTDKTTPEVPPPAPAGGRTSEKTRARLSDLRPHPRNPRKISPARLEQLQRTLEAEPDMLDARPIIALPDGTVVAGNQRLAAAAALGWESIPVVYADLSPEEVTRWMLLDNRGFGEDDRDAVAQLLGELEAADSDLELTGYDPADLDAMLRELNRPAADPDEAPPLPGEAKSVLGEVYELGPHRVMCGDSTDEAHVDALVGTERPAAVWADPPYGIAYRAMRRTDTIEGDQSIEHAKTLLEDALSQTPARACFVCCDWRSVAAAREAMRAAGHKPKACIVWDKTRSVQNLDLFAKQHEFVLYAGPFGGERTIDGDVWSIARDYAPDHPTPKPVELVERALAAATHRGNSVYDPFAGAGSVVIAAERLGLRAFAMEIDPAYCDVIRQRYADYVGRPELAP